MRVPAGLIDAGLAALAVFGLTPLLGRRPDEISGGQRQQVYLSQVQFREPRVLLPDEPAAALDTRHQLRVLDRLRDHARATGPSSPWRCATGTLRRSSPTV